MGVYEALMITRVRVMLILLLPNRALPTSSPAGGLGRNFAFHACVIDANANINSLSRKGLVALRLLEILKIPKETASQLRRFMWS